MDVERLAEEYVKRKAHAEALTKEVADLRDMLKDHLAEVGTPDEKGSKWYTAGRWQLKLQKSQGEPYLDVELAEDWAKERGIWDEVKVVRETLNQDALAGYVFEHRDDPEVEAGYRGLFIEPKPTWSLIKPQEQENYDY